MMILVTINILCGVIYLNWLEQTQKTQLNAFSNLEALWRTRKTGLNSADRKLFCDMLELDSDSELDPLLACLRILICKCVHENINKDEIQIEVLPELQKLLTILLQKFQNEWREDVQQK